MKLFLSLLQLFCFLVEDSLSSEIDIKLPSSCNDLSDGTHYIQPVTKSEYAQVMDISEDEVDAPPIKVVCSNGYTIINPKLDSNVQHYFTSYHSWHQTFAGPSIDDHTSWEEWWIPSKVDNYYNSDTVGTSDINTDIIDSEDILGLEYEDIGDPWNDELKDTLTKWSVSEDCNTCIDSDDLDYKSATSYYMTGDTYGCNWYTKFICDFDVETLECYQCESKTSLSNDLYYGKCGHMPLPAYSNVHSQHKYCTEGNGEYLPSIGTTNQYCVCYKPSLSKYSKLSLNEENEMDPLTNANDIINSEETMFDEDAKRIIYLKQSDFDSGTYRITRSGTYVLEEDIIFDFNAGDIDSPNNAHSWMPHSSQSDMYSGAAETEWDGPYWLGFFAGITIEADDVTLDLAKHEIRMSHAFYLQQRVFSCIELNNKMFRDGEGPTWMGADLVTVTNIIIQNGVIGLSSHLGIHGNSVYSLTLKDLHIKDFETHGIGINEFYGLTMLDTEIGPSVNGQLGLNGIYTLARSALPIFRDAGRMYEDGVISLAGHMPTTINNLIHILTTQMDLAFKYAYLGEKPSIEDGEDYDTWLKAEKLFINDWGVPRAGVVYGALLRSRGASVFGYGKYNGGRSKSLSMTNVNIHDLTLSMEEIISVGNTRHRWIKDMFNGPLPLRYATDNEFSNIGESIYTGNAWTDLILALRLIDDSWWHLGRLTLWHEFLTWARDGSEMSEALNGEDNIYMHCNNDYLGHVPKGAIGLRLENIDDININNLEISYINAVSPLGSDECGHYTGGDDGGMPLQNSGTNPGYGGTTSRGIYMYELVGVTFNNLYVHNIVSLNGPSNGMYVYETPEMKFNGNSRFEHIYAGLELFDRKSLLGDQRDFSENNWPNLAARSCAIEMEKRSSLDADSDEINVSCMVGHSYCECNSDQYAKEMMIGEIMEQKDGSRNLLWSQFVSGFKSKNIDNIDRYTCVVSEPKECKNDVSYNLPYHNVYVSKTGEVTVENDYLNGGYQARSFKKEEEESKNDLKKNMKHLMSQNSNIINEQNNLHIVGWIVLIGMLFVVSISYFLYRIGCKKESI